ncbi:MAG: 5-oxoprolinase subunit PxpB [Psychroserpens sp.]|uniref:5-oxoprolinase subunit PxpB n=1 Tax=Psychroserpens sp. TaxID=2020870 RepID=UPI0030012E81
MDFELTYRRFSERSILVEWPTEITENILDDVLIFKNHLLNSRVKSIVQVNNAYSSILIIYKFTIDNVYGEILMLKTSYSDRVSKTKRALKHWRIPVCYDNDFGLDLVEISENKKLSKLEIIKLHSEAIYIVFFVGFLPGFLYLGGLDKRLYFPRKKSPRLHIEKGAVAIGGQQTGVYPNLSPGGWNIIGNSPIHFFDPNKREPCFAKSGDKIQFIPIDRSQYDEIQDKIDNGSYQIESEVFYG